MILSLSLNLLLIRVYFLLFIIDFMTCQDFLCLIYTHSVDHGSAFFLHSEAIDLIYFCISCKKESCFYAHVFLLTQIICF